MWPPPRLAARSLRLAGVLLLVLWPGACGLGGGNSSAGELVGGVVRPSLLAYDATVTADAILPGVVEANLPTAVDLRLDGIIPPVKNQLWNSCVAWSFAYYVMSAVEARRLRDVGLFVDMNDSDNWFSPEFLYSQRDTLAEREAAFIRREADGDPIPGGICFEFDGEIGCMRPERALEVLMERGCCPWNWLCDEVAGAGFRPCADHTRFDATNVSRSAWQFALEGAGRFRPRCYVRFGALDDLNQATVRRLQDWLHTQGTPIAMVVNMTTGWVSYADGEPLEHVTVDACGRPQVEMRPACLDAGGSALGSQHMMTIIGYDRSFPSAAQYPNTLEGCEGSFLVINQWGEKWGDAGLMWIPCAELARIWVGGYGILAGDELVVEPDSASTLRDFVCVRDGNGRYLQVSADGNDVPVSLLTACEILELDDARRGPTPGDACVGGLDDAARAAFRAECDAEADVPALHTYLGACRLPLPVLDDTGGIVHGPASIAGRDASTGQEYDQADWFYVDIPADAGDRRLEVRLRALAPAPSVPDAISVEVTDVQYAPRGVPLLGEDGVAAPVATEGGRYFVRVASSEGIEPPEGTPAFPYALEMRLLRGTVGEGGPGVPTCLEATPVPFSLNGAGAGGSGWTFGLSSLVGNREVEFRLTDLAGADPDVEMHVIVLQDFNFGPELRPLPQSDAAACDFTVRTRPSERWYRQSTVHKVGAEGGAVRVRVSGDLGRGAYLGGRNARGITFVGYPDFTVPEIYAHRVFIDLRNRSGAPVTGTLEAKVCGVPPGALTPTLAPVGGFDGGILALPMRLAWERVAYERRHLELQLEDVCGDPELRLFDGADRDITNEPGFVVEDVVRRSGTVVMRVSVPSWYLDDVWFRIFERGTTDMTPLGYRMRQLRGATLGSWPSVQDVDAAQEDADGTPSRATERRLSDLLASPAGGTVSYADWLDFHRVVNDTGVAQRVSLKLRRAPDLCDENPIIFASHWPAALPADPLAEAASEFFCHPCSIATARTGGSDHDLISFDLEPGAAQIVQVQFWEIALQFIYRDPAAYELEFTATPR